MLELLFRLSSDNDISEIYEWLDIQERFNTHGTFLCNWNMTKKVHNKGHLLVAIHNGSPIAYLWMDFGILEVKYEYRNNGVGSKLVNHALDIKRESGSLSISIECTPQTSIPFWLKMGFKLYKNNLAYYLINSDILENHVGIPTEIDIYFYPNEKEWAPETKFIDVYRPKAVTDAEGVIHLSERVSIYCDLPVWNGDPIIGIFVNGMKIHLDKAKYESSKVIGVLTDGGAFAIEKIHPQKLAI
jgi:GNAT superfamily N-acetyltransferase